MNGIETIEFFETKLKAAATLKGLNIETDPYSKLEDRVPFILIEHSPGRLKTMTGGKTTGHFHTIDFFVVISSSGKTFKKRRAEVEAMAEKLILVLNNSGDSNARIVQKDDRYEVQEVVIGALKCTGVLITKEVETNL